jgi:glutamyl-tRNA reductase
VRDDLVALVAHARDVSAADRHALGAWVREHQPIGAVALETCHRMELYGEGRSIRDVPPGLTGGFTIVEGRAAWRHVIRVAVGLESAVVGEDQVLHQLRASVAAARGRGPLAPALDHLLDVALRAGRRGRSWLPSKRGDLAHRALEIVTARHGSPAGTVLVVGAGEMARLAAFALVGSGTEVVVTSRRQGSAEHLSRLVRAPAWPWEPPPASLARVSGVVVALAGPWPLPAVACDALARSDAWVIDLSAPPAVPGALIGALTERGRWLSVEDLARAPAPGLPDGLVERLGALVDEALSEQEAWARSEPEREAARALARHAQEVRERELEALFRRSPSLGEAEREAVERMAVRLAEGLLRTPLERLHHDDDGRHGRAARELFGL